MFTRLTVKAAVFALAIVGFGVAAHEAVAQSLYPPPSDGGGGRGMEYDPCAYGDCRQEILPRRPRVTIVRPYYNEFEDFQEYPVERPAKPRIKQVKPTKKPPAENAGSGASAAQAAQSLRVPDEVLVEIPLTVPQADIDALAQEQRIEQLGSQEMGLLNSRIHRWRITDRRSVEAVIRTLTADRRVAAAQPMNLFTLQESAESGASPPQYAVEKLRLQEAHRMTRGETVLVAVIDSGIDTGHPELADVVSESFDAVGGTFEPHAHGTGMAGAIGAHDRLTGVAPAAHILAVRAFSPGANGGNGTTFDVVRGMDWAASKKARVFNLSFAGPRDVLLSRTVQAAISRGIVVVAAAGNAGPKSPPLYPGAEPGVIAVTATDAKDGLMKTANRGDYVSVAAPGVDILLPTPQASYAVSTGTSVAAAYVTGVAALMLSQSPELNGKEVYEVLRGTAHDLGPKGKDKDFGAGLADPVAALDATSPVEQAVTAPDEPPPVR